MNEVIEQEASFGGPGELRALAEFLGISVEEAQQGGINLLIAAAVQANEEGRVLAPGHAQLLREIARADPYVVASLQKLLEEIYH